MSRVDARGPADALLVVLRELAQATGSTDATNAQLCAALGKRHGDNGTTTQVARALRTLRRDGAIRTHTPATGGRRVIEVV